MGSPGSSKKGRSPGKSPGTLHGFSMPLMEAKQDPLFGVKVQKKIEGAIFQGEVISIEVGSISKDRLYRVRHEDNDEEHYVESEVIACRIKEPKSKDAKKVRKDITKDKSKGGARGQKKTQLDEEEKEEETKPQEMEEVVEEVPENRKTPKAKGKSKKDKAAVEVDIADEKPEEPEE